MIESANHYLCIHGHFYQPPRENPWLEAIELQESAHPFHDWNEKITHECYTANARARILDGQGLLRITTNNYEHISFNFGPTLFSWLEHNAPETFDLIIQADKLSVQRRSGHGNALAQAYNHMIMPLASTRDKITQAVWGIEDFRKRFGRDPEGMWLPEAAVDGETLDILVQHGIKFTLLAPRQAHSFRESADSPWTFVNSSIDPSRPYRCELNGGRSITIFFYDGPISQAVAFQNLLGSGEDFKHRLMAAFSDRRSWPQLVHIATDGESYGHHHRFGEMALAYALEKLIADPTVKLTNYGEFLQAHPATAEVCLHERSSWSCVHGIGRWSEDCGCSSGFKPEWNQQWRAPLRRALDLLRDRADALFIEKGKAFFSDPWEVRNKYIGVILNDHEDTSAFLDIHTIGKLSTQERVWAVTLLEIQRNRMLMYTSCGWFFDDISGIESLQILGYAARVLHLAFPWEPDLLKDFLAELSSATSNMKPQLCGDEIFRSRVLPHVAGLAQVAAHVAVSSVFEDRPVGPSFYCYDIKVNKSNSWSFGDRALFIGHVTVHSRITMERGEFLVVVLHLGGVDFRCSVQESPGKKSLYPKMLEELPQAFLEHSSTELIRKLDTFFPGRYFSLKDLFAEQRCRIIETVTEKMFEDQASLFDTFYKKNKDLAKLIIEQEARIPDTFRAAAEFALNRMFTVELNKLEQGIFPDRLEAVMEEAEFWRIRLDKGLAEKMIGNRILNLVGSLSKHPKDKKITAEITRFLNMGNNLEIHMRLAEAQILFLAVVRSLEAGGGKLPPHIQELALRLAVKPAET